MTKKERDELLEIVRNGRLRANHPEIMFVHQISKNPQTNKIREDYFKSLDLLEEQLLNHECEND